MLLVVHHLAYEEAWNIRACIPSSGKPSRLRSDLIVERLEEGVSLLDASWVGACGDDSFHEGTRFVELIEEDVQSRAS